MMRFGVIELLLSVMMCGCASSRGQRDVAPTKSPRAVASTSVDGLYSLIAIRCAAIADYDGVARDLALLRTLPKASVPGGVQTDATQTWSASERQASLSIDHDRFAYRALIGECRTQRLGAIAAEGDHFLLRQSHEKGCDETIQAINPEAFLSRSVLQPVGEFLVQSIPHECGHGRTLQYVWIPAASS